MAYRLLEQFAGVFSGRFYNHRQSTIGDEIAGYLFEDLVALDGSPKLVRRVTERKAVLNVQNRAVGKRTRRGDGTFGEIVPGAQVSIEPGLYVARARIASIDIGAETKILAKAMIKQIDRVCNDLEKQADQFRTINGQAICVAIVGINFADQYLSVEGTRPFPTDGRRYKHPIQEAMNAEKRVLDRVTRIYDELLILRFKATNQPPYQFEWMDQRTIEEEYGAALARISRLYEQRF